MHKILITGGCGFIGTNLAEYLLANGGYRLTLLDNFSNAVYGAVRYADDSSVRMIEGDIRDRQACLQATEGQDALVHLAADTQVIESLRNPDHCYDVNLQGTINLLEACRLNHVPEFVLASSNAAVGGSASPVNEEAVPRPMSPYGAAKLAGEALCSAYAYSYGISTVALRFSNVYGPHCQRKSSVIAKFMRQLIEAAPLTIFGDGSQSRDFIHVGDLCNAIHLCLSRKEEGGAQIFQVASGKETSVLELIELLAQVIHTRPALRFEPVRQGEIFKNVSNISMIREHLGFTPKIALAEGIESLYQWLLRDGTLTPVPSV
jgi:UDP-glucose 4-epimerase